LHEVFDVGVIGEGEQTLAELTKLKSFSPEELRKVKGIVFDNCGNLEFTPPRMPIPNLDDLPFPNFKFISNKYFQKEEIPSISDIGVKGFMMTSRGCPYRCVFCSTARFWGNMRFHSPEYTAKMAKKMIEDYGVDFLKIMDDLFTVSVDRMKDIKKCFDNANILARIKAIECQPRANLMTDELCLAMKELKIKTVNFGFESGSDKMLRWLKQESVSVADNYNAILLCEKHGLNAYGSLMYGSPGETIEDMKETNKFIDFAIKHNAKYIWSFISTPFPMTPFWDIALERKKVSAGMDWNLLSHHTETPLLLDDNISQDDFQKVFKEGKSKLRRLKIKMIKQFVIKHPFTALKMVATEPSYYISRVWKQVFKQ
jgi:radical SAM superfamily enzyme YgiQ (UPF0313 family)